MDLHSQHNCPHFPLLKPFRITYRNSLTIQSSPSWDLKSNIDKLRGNLILIIKSEAMTDHFPRSNNMIIVQVHTCWREAGKYFQFQFFAQCPRRPTHIHTIVPSWTSFATFLTAAAEYYKETFSNLISLSYSSSSSSSFRALRYLHGLNGWISAPYAILPGAIPPSCVPLTVSTLFSLSLFFFLYISLLHNFQDRERETNTGNCDNSLGRWNKTLLYIPSKWLINLRNGENMRATYRAIWSTCHLFQVLLISSS